MQIPVEIDTPGTDGKARLGQDPRSSDFADVFTRYLVKNAIVERADGARAAAAQAQTGERIDVVLTELGIISSDELLKVLAEYFGIPLVDKTSLFALQSLEEELPVEFVKRNKILPLGREEDQLVLAISDPFAGEALSAVQFLTDVSVSVRLARKNDMEAVISQLEEEASQASGEEEEHHAELFADISSEDIQRLKDIASEAPVIRYLAKLIADAVAMRASDIHIEPLVNGTRVRMRIDGVMAETGRLPAEIQAGVISRIKILARLNIAERRLPQDGRAKFVIGGNEIDLRVSTMPTIYGESTVLRVLDSNTVTLSFPELGFDSSQIEALRRILSRPNGIVLVTGPTGSGKTTTLYTALKTLNSTERKIFTVEDPIEYEMPGLNQIQVHPQIGLDFAPALRSILRQDPDIIMIGEMRDLETVRIGIQAALTGHLVLSTLHTNSAPASIMRLLDIGAEDYLLGSSLNAVAAQRLVRTVCPHCSTDSKSAADQIRKLDLKRIFSSSSVPDLSPKQPVGCENCNGTGYSGRTTIFELLEINDEIRTNIKTGVSESQLRQSALESGMVSLLQSGVKKAMEGKTTLEEVFKVVSQ